MGNAMEAMEAYKRVCDLLEIKSQKEFAGVVGTKQPTVNYALRKGSIPSNWLMALLRKYQINPDWVVGGEKFPKYVVYTNNIGGAADAVETACPE